MRTAFCFGSQAVCKSSRYYFGNLRVNLAGLCLDTFPQANLTALPSQLF
jgi:hypothetical protein